MRRQIIVAVVTAIVALVVVVVVLVAEPAHSSPTTALTGHPWTLTRIVVDGHELTVLDANPVTLKFNAQDNTVSGNSGCNVYGSSFTVMGNQIQFEGIRGTLVFCSDAGVMELETAYTDALRRVETYHLDGDTLTLEGADGQVLLTFQ